MVQKQELASTGIAAAVQISARPDITTTTVATTSSVEIETIEISTSSAQPAPSEVATSSSAAATSGTFSSPSGSLEASEESSTSEVPGVVKVPTVPTSTASTSQEFQVEQVTLSADEEDGNLPQDSALAPVLGISLAALVVCGGCLVWRGRQRQISAHEQVSTTKGAGSLQYWQSFHHCCIAWASKELTQVHLYPWDYAADKIAGMIWTSNQRVHAEMEEDSATRRISSVAQSPNPAHSETPSLSASYGSEAGQAVAAAASQVRTACTAASIGDGDSTRPSSGTSNRSPGEAAMPRPVAQVVQVPQPVALPSAPSAPSIPVPIPVPPRGARSPMRKVNWPEDNPAATTLRVAAAPKHDITLAPSEPSEPLKPSKPSKALVSNTPSSHPSSYPSSIPFHLQPPSTPTSPDTSPSSPNRPPRSSPVVSVRVTRRSEATHISQSSQPSQPSQPSRLPNLPGIPGVVKGDGTSSSSAQVEDRRDSWEPSRTPNSQTPRTDTESPPPRRIPRHMVRAVALTPRGGDPTRQGEHLHGRLIAGHPQSHGEASKRRPGLSALISFRESVLKLSVQLFFFVSHFPGRERGALSFSLSPAFCVFSIATRASPSKPLHSTHLPSKTLARQNCEPKEQSAAVVAAVWTLLCRQSKWSCGLEILEFTPCETKSQKTLQPAVGESVAKPLWYYENNLTGTLNILKAMEKHGCKLRIWERA
eukprot:s3706_g1.t1